MHKIYLDIETIPPDRSEPRLRDKLANCAEDEYRALALNPGYGRILCAGIILEQDGQIVRRGVLGRGRESSQFHLDEARTLRGFWRLLSDFDPREDCLIGFNLLDFDLAFLTLRSAIHNVKPSVNICFARYRRQPIYDVMWEFCNWRSRISLEEAARILGLESPKRNGLNGATVYDYFLAGRHEEIAAYCMADVEITRAIYHRLNFITNTHSE